MTLRVLASMIAALVLAISACSADEAASTRDDPGAATAPTDTAAEQVPDDPVPDVEDRSTEPTAPRGQPFTPEICVEMESALRALTLPVEGTDAFDQQLDASIEAIGSAIEAMPGYTADQLALLRGFLEDARPMIEQRGYVAWQEAIVESRSGEEADDIDVQTENLRQYVLPRC